MIAQGLKKCFCGFWAPHRKHGGGNEPHRSIDELKASLADCSSLLRELALSHPEKLAVVDKKLFIAREAIFHPNDLQCLFV